MDSLTAADFETLGLYDPAEPHAARKLELLDYLVGLGATARGGRVVKLIGDAVMYVVTGESAALSIALDVIAVVSEHSRVPPVRGGVAAGGVLTRNGDVFGPVVNLAARAVKLAAAGEVVAPVALAAVAGIEATPLGRHRLRGFADDVDLCRLRVSHPERRLAA